MALTNMIQAPEGRTVRVVLKTGEAFRAWIGCNSREDQVLWIDRGEGLNEPVEYRQIDRINVLIGMTGRVR